MIYLLLGSEPYLIENKIKQIIAELPKQNIYKYDGQDKNFNLSAILVNLNEIGLFADNKVILLKDPIFLIKKIADNDFDAFLAYCQQPYYENTLIIYTLENLFNEKLKCFKEIAKNAQIIKFDQLKRNDFYTCCQSIINDRHLKINNESLNTLIHASNNSLSIFNANADILSLYPEEITLEIINQMLISSDDEDIFNLINSLVVKNVSKSIRLARKIMHNDNNINGLIALLAMQLRFLYEVALYTETGLSRNTIMDKMDIKNPYRLDKAYESLRHIKRKEILKLLDELSNLDYKVKIDSSIDERERLELFIVSLLNNEKN